MVVTKSLSIILRVHQKEIPMMRSILAIYLVLFLTVVGITPLRASEEKSLALCLRGKFNQSDVCETVRCRMEECQSAAQKGHAKAILLIGMAHVYGKGVSKNYVKAYMYFRVLHHVSDTLDKRQRHEAKEHSQRLMTELKERMTPGDISLGETLARKWINDNL